MATCNGELSGGDYSAEEGPRSRLRFAEASLEQEGDMPEPRMDTARADAFMDQLVTMLNSGALALMTSIGHRTGLFDSMGEMPPSTSEQIAAASGLNERYVREWLGAMVVGGIVEHSPEGKLYWLPLEHASCLTRQSEIENLAVYAQYISVLGGVEDRIIDCFRNGGGVPYSEYNRFHEVMAEDSGQTVIPALIDSILPLVPGLREALEQGIEVLDVGCGRGRAINLLAKTFPNSRFIGYDLSEEAIAAAMAEAETTGARNVAFEAKDLTHFPVEEEFHLITAFDAIHDQARPDTVLSGIAAALRHGGTFLMQDIAGSSHVHNNVEHPIGAFLYTISCMHCMSVSLAQEGAGLGAMWGEEKAQEMLQQAGFSNVEVKSLPHDIQNSYYVASKS